MSIIESPFWLVEALGALPQVRGADVHPAPWWGMDGAAFSEIFKYV
ncbi:hypothetical protein [Pseudomonas proteolytica]|jgi:hypothetical protein|nr:hypothetical protein [Pseudomonas proteolytica]NMY95366.1 hypothetical protein [Pseudomonas proteolytica]NMY99193.1 hypothetical protein [Pseudomonas proteolytica]